MKKCIAAILIVATVFTLAGCQSKNVFSQYLDLMGKSVNDIPGDYDVSILSDGLATASLPADDVFGLPGEIEYYVMYDKGLEDDGTINIVGWGSENEDDLSEEEVEAFVDNMIDIYGDYDKKELQKSESWLIKDQTMYWWESPDKYNVKMMVNEDGSKITIAFQSK